MKIKKHFLGHILLIAIISLLIIPACNKETELLEEFDVSDIDVFIWNGLRQYYLWVDEVPELAASAYNSDSELVQFLNAYNEDHEELFTDLLYSYGTIDKWSWIVDDYVALENFFQGITTSMGFEYGLKYIGTTDNVFGYIQYVVPDSPADVAGLVRGEIFTAIDGQILTENNYRSLLYNRDAYDISFADDTFTSNGKTISLTAAVVAENPIHYSEIMDVDGIKVAYLVYNGFTSTYDFELNDLFATYRAAGVQELILDLRYNGGGALLTTTYLASMIYGTETESIFSSRQYNELLQNYFEDQYGDSYFDNPFADEIGATEDLPSEAINTLNLSRLYVLSTKGTASASELLINGLNPYMDVVIIGTNTHGKYVGSVTLKDYNSEGDLNTSHTWAMQPIILKTTNSVGFSDFVDGFVPTVYTVEDFTNVLPFGDENDPLLKAAIDNIKGIPPTLSTKSFMYNDFIDSKDLKRFGKEMYVNQKLIK